MNTHLQLSNPQATSYLIIVMGVAGSGKSTLAKALAEHYGYAYWDGDDFHSDEARALMAQGIPLTDDQRAPWVARIKEQLEARARQHGHTVLAFSGLKQKHRQILRSAGLRTLVIYLHGDTDTIRDRVENRKGHFMAPELISSQFASMEEPANETDVFPIDIRQPLASVLASAIAAVDSLLVN